VKQLRAAPLRREDVKPETASKVQVAPDGLPPSGVKPEISPTAQTAVNGAPPGDAKPETSPTAQLAEYGGPPPPDLLFREAMEEPDRQLLADYADTIRLLRDDKRFSFREIAEWLQGYGIECDHNSVYREYTKFLSFEEEREEALRSMEEDNERP
jgi:hypothetical protein